MSGRKFIEITLKRYEWCCEHPICCIHYLLTYVRLIHLARLGELKGKILRLKRKLQSMRHRKCEDSISSC
jgi:hypothetical protein